MRRWAPGALVLIGIGFVVALAYLVQPKADDRAESSEAGRSDGSPSTLLASHRGQVLVLLAGMEGCPGTRAATRFLKTYAADKDPNVSIVRLDVPPPGGKLSPADASLLPFDYVMDRERIVANELGFFYYPTLYILDREGEVRFAGECDEDRFPGMVSEILAEKPGDPKHVYTPPLAAVGAPAPAFSSTTLDGNTVTLDELRGEKATALIFSRTGCPFSLEAVPSMRELQESFRDKQVAVLIVNDDEVLNTIRPIYQEHAPGITVIVDETGEIAESYGASAVPFVFVLDGEGNVASRMPYTHDAAANALNVVLGLAPATKTTPKTGAG